MLEPPASPAGNVCTGQFGATGICIVPSGVDFRAGTFPRPVSQVKLSGIYVAGFGGSDVVAFGTAGLSVSGMTAAGAGGARNGDVQIDRCAVPARQGGRQR